MVKSHGQVRSFLLSSSRSTSMSPPDESVLSKPPPIVSLPPSYSPATEASTKRYLIDLASFLSSPFARALVDSHPNRAVGGVQGSGEELEDVWRWAGEVGVREKEEREEVLGKLCAGEVEQTVSRPLTSQAQRSSHPESDNMAFVLLGPYLPPKPPPNPHPALSSSRPPRPSLQASPPSQTIPQKGPRSRPPSYSCRLSPFFLLKPANRRCRRWPRLPLPHACPPAVQLSRAGCRQR
jgi:hypothetical protein